MKRASAGGAGTELRSDGGESKELPPPGWKRNPALLLLRGVDEVLSSHLFLAAHEKAPLAQYRSMLATFEMSAHSAFWIGGVAFLLWFFAIDVSLRTFLLNLFLALLIDVVLVAVLKAVARRRRPGVSREQYENEPLSSNLSFPSGFTSRAFLVTLIVIKHSHLFPLFKLPFIAWSIAVAICKLLMGRQFLGDSLAGVALGYIEYHWIVSPMWLSEETASYFFNGFNALEEPTYDALL
uniref:Putative presqualene diphosphate phosphatase ixodes scapularis presqualene diphosphate phosphatase n=1 Tax=Amblyomma parvum TaxID=251391 RepID=A0A023FUS2_AMBPA